MVKVFFFTPVGKFTAVFDDMEQARNDIGESISFDGSNGDTLVIPAELQRNSVIVLREE